MRIALAASLLVALGAVAAPPSRAAPLTVSAAPADPAVTLIEGGCGPAFFRAPNGFCYRRPAYGYGYRPAPPPYRRPVCGFRFHPTPYGCRPNY